jgi:hypothetical protein
MRNITGIEIGPESCVLARIRRDRGVPRVLAVHGVRADEALLPDVDRAEHLRQVRREKGFPRHAVVVWWGLAEGASSGGPLTKAALAPLLEAGFVIDAVLSPPEALAVLARQRPRVAGRTSAAWLSLNRDAAAIAIVDDGDLLFSRVFDWHYRSATTLREELLQRYLLVAHLAPELRHGFDVVGSERGVTVDAIVTCGGLPDLRSLTMPLIEELDMEVETLDSFDGLDLVDPTMAQEIGERAPALRLACAVAADPKLGGRRDPVRTSMVAAAAVVAALVVSSVLWLRDGAEPVAGAPTASPAEARIASTAPRPAPSSPAQTSPAPRPPDEPPIAPPQRGRGPIESPMPAATTGRGVPPGRIEPPRTAARQGPEVRETAPLQPPLSVGRRPQPAPLQPAGRVADRPPRKPLPLNAPLPVVNSILVSPDRRLAVVDGEIVREGQAVGPRLLIRIEPGELVLREPSGHEVRVPIRRRVGTPQPPPGAG